MLNLLLCSLNFADKMINESIFGLTTTREEVKKADNRQNRLLHLVSVNVNDSIKRLAAKHIFWTGFFQSNAERNYAASHGKKDIFSDITTTDTEIFFELRVASAPCTGLWTLLILVDYTMYHRRIYPRYIPWIIAPS